MAFIVEDGTGVTNATSYSDVAFADAYFSDRAKTEWAAIATVELKEAALILATDYIDFRWGAFLRGSVVKEDQALEFPRNVFVDSATDLPHIPDGLKKATAEYALRASQGELAPDPQTHPSGYQVSRRMEKVGPIEERTDFAFLGPGSSRRLITPYPAADLLMRPFLRASQARVVRN